MSQIYNFACLYNFYYGKKHDKIIIPIKIDISKCRYPNGKEDWNAETPLVIKEIGFFNETLIINGEDIRNGIFNQQQPFDYVYGSEPSYDEYFKKAYPFATHIIIDTTRTAVPISATIIRDMDAETAKKYITFDEKTIDKLLKM
uniref:Uncharacterized protein n=1 Tax=Siphoviridae sp. ctTnV63 TaxID=2825523 RepID=A0A8S5NVS8_9CAUD|nr:MAG TPA: hypothetical protein [Siphoviridae sp. ctTnV63]